MKSLETTLRQASLLLDAAIKKQLETRRLKHNADQLAEAIEKQMEARNKNYTTEPIHFAEHATNNLDAGLAEIRIKQLEEQLRSCEKALELRDLKIAALEATIADLKNPF